jgi:hypothetical protein
VCGDEVGAGHGHRGYDDTEQTRGQSKSVVSQPRKARNLRGQLLLPTRDTPLPVSRAPGERRVRGDEVGARCGHGGEDLLGRPPLLRQLEHLRVWRVEGFHLGR